MLALPYSNITFHFTSIKPYLIPANQIKGIKIKPTSEDYSKEPIEPSTKPIKNPVSSLPIKRPRGRPYKH